MQLENLLKLVTHLNQIKEKNKFNQQIDAFQSGKLSSSEFDINYEDFKAFSDILLQLAESENKGVAVRLDAGKLRMLNIFVEQFRKCTLEIQNEIHGLFNAVEKKCIKYSAEQKFSAFITFVKDFIESLQEGNKYLENISAQEEEIYSNNVEPEIKFMIFHSIEMLSLGMPDDMLQQVYRQHMDDLKSDNDQSTFGYLSSLGASILAANEGVIFGSPENIIFTEFKQQINADLSSDINNIRLQQLENVYKNLEKFRELQSSESETVIGLMENTLAIFNYVHSLKQPVNTNAVNLLEQNFSDEQSEKELLDELVEEIQAKPHPMPAESKKEVEEPEQSVGVPGSLPPSVDDNSIVEPVAFFPTKKTKEYELPENKPNEKTEPEQSIGVPGSVPSSSVSNSDKAQESLREAKTRKPEQQENKVPAAPTSFSRKKKVNKGKNKRVQKIPTAPNPDTTQQNGSGRQLHIQDSDEQLSVSEKNEQHCCMTTAFTLATTLVATSIATLWNLGGRAILATEFNPALLNSTDPTVNGLFDFANGFVTLKAAAATFIPSSVTGAAIAGIANGIYQVPRWLAGTAAGVGYLGSGAMSLVALFNDEAFQKVIPWAMPAGSATPVVLASSAIALGATAFAVKKIASCLTSPASFFARRNPESTPLLMESGEQNQSTRKFTNA